MKKDLFINVGLAAGSLIIFVLLVEFGLRVTGLQTVKPNPPQIYISDDNPNISYKLKPSLQREPAYRATVSTDGLGLRLNNRTKNLVILGDSIAFGYGVHDDETLAAHLGGINAAVPGYQLQQQRALYEDYVQPNIEHDSVMIVFYWNDLDGLKPGKLDSKGILRGHDWQPSEDNRSWLERHSAFYIAYQKLLSLRSSKKHMAQEREQPMQETVNATHFTTYLNDLRAFSATLPQERIFVIWPDNLLHEEVRQELAEEAQAMGFIVIDLYEVFSNKVETLGWDTVHPSAASLEKAGKYIQSLLYSGS